MISERENLCSALLNGTRIPALFGEDNRGNVFWGIVIQTEWQIRSFRQQPKKLERIEEFAWFAGINYQLVVVPYLAAINSGLVPLATLAPPKLNTRSKFPITYEAISPDLTNGWTKYFETIKILQVNSSYISLKYLQKLLWSVHSQTLYNALPLFEHELKLLNTKERKFANGFGHFVEIPSMINLNTGHDAMFMLNKLFPMRILRLTDVPMSIRDMSVEQNIVLFVFFVIDEMTKLPAVWKPFLEVVRMFLSYSQL